MFWFPFKIFDFSLTSFLFAVDYLPTIFYSCLMNGSQKLFWPLFQSKNILSI